MGTKVKGLLKGLRYISNIFEEEEEEEEEIQIGMPTDVKHVAHIGADGPATESPSWMKEFEGGQNQSGPLDSTSGERPEIKKGTNHRISRSEEITRDIPDLPKSSRQRRRSMDNALDPDSQAKDSSTKPKHTRRQHKGRRSQDAGDDSPNTKLPDIPKKSRRKKTKEDGGSTRSSKSKGSESPSNEPSDL